MVIGLALLLLFAVGYFFTVLNGDDDSETWNEKGEEIGETATDESTISRRREFKSRPIPIANSAEASGDLQSGRWVAKFGAAVERGRARLTLKIQDAKGQPLVPRFAANAQLRLSAQQGSYWLDRPLVYDWENSEILCPPAHHPGLEAGHYRLEASFGPYGDLDFEFSLSRNEERSQTLKTRGFSSEVVLSFRDGDGRAIPYTSFLPQFIPRSPIKLPALLPALPSVFSARPRPKPRRRDIDPGPGPLQPAALALQTAVATDDGKIHLPIIAGQYGQVRVPFDEDPLFDTPSFERRDNFLSSSQRSIDIHVETAADYSRLVRELMVSSRIQPGSPRRTPADFLRLPKIQGSKPRERAIPSRQPKNSVLLRIKDLKSDSVKPWIAHQNTSRVSAPAFFAHPTGSWCLLKLKTPYLLGAHDGMGFFTRPTSFVSGGGSDEELGAEIEINRQGFSLALSVPRTLAAWAQHAALLWHFPSGAFATSLRNQKAWRGALRFGQVFRFETAVDAAWPASWPDSTRVEFRFSASAGGQSRYDPNGDAAVLAESDVHFLHQFEVAALKSAGTTQTALNWKSLGPETSAATATGFLARCVGDSDEGLPWVEACLVTAKQDLAAIGGGPLKRKDDRPDGRLQDGPHDSWHNPQSHHFGDDEGYLVVPADRANAMTAGKDYVLYLWSRSRDANRPDRRIVFRAQKGWTDLGVIRLASY